MIGDRLNVATSWELVLQVVDPCRWVRAGAQLIRYRELQNGLNLAAQSRSPLGHGIPKLLARMSLVLLQQNFKDQRLVNGAHWQIAEDAERIIFETLHER